MDTNEKPNLESIVDEEMDRWDAILGIFPFALFGLVGILDKAHFPYIDLYHFLAFKAIVQLGLLIGFAKGFSRWTYSYLGWSMTMYWWWMGMPMYAISNRYSPITYNQLLDWWSWIPPLDHEQCRPAFYAITPAASTLDWWHMAKLDIPLPDDLCLRSICPTVL